MRLAGTLSGLALTAGAILAVITLDPSQSPAAQAARLAADPAADVHELVRVSGEAVRRDPANSYLWATLGEALARAGDVNKARLAFKTALDTGPNVPQILLRDTNFHVQQGEVDLALTSARRVLEMIPYYDDALFHLFDGLAVEPLKVLAVIGNDRRAARAYTQHLIAAGPPESASDAWNYFRGKGYEDKALTSDYLDALLRAKRYDQAQADWNKVTGRSALDQPDRDLVFNGGFEHEPNNAVFDWRIRSADHIEAKRDDSVAHAGKTSLKIQFPGTANMFFSSASETIRAIPGHYTLRAWVRTRDITTDEGPRLEILDSEANQRLDVQTASFTGTSDWTLVSQSVTITSSTNLVLVRVIRMPSNKFDNKIAGTFWLDDVSLVKD